MAKSVQKVKASLKLRTQAREGALSLKLGTKRYVLPFEVRLLTSNEFVFVHVPPTAEILKINGKSVATVTDLADAEAAAKSFRKGRKKSTSRGTSKVEIPGDVKAALSKIPTGYKLAYNQDGSFKLVRTRNRSKTK
ncbi:MAG: hypothetical protein JNM34_03055 [Chthonomonadaceae bacterium]|nr:hypothetical protein [Chthonomonadaceae bacterium]